MKTSIDVTFITTTSEKLHTVPKIEGQIISCMDTSAMFYDMGKDQYGNVIRRSTSIVCVNSLPTSGIQNVLYIVVSGPIPKMYIWQLDKHTNVYKFLPISSQEVDFEYLIRSKASAIISKLSGDQLFTQSSAVAPLMNFKLFGKSTQEKTDGVNVYAGGDITRTWEDSIDVNVGNAQFKLECGDIFQQGGFLSFDCDTDVPIEAYVQFKGIDVNNWGEGTTFYIKSGRNTVIIPEYAFVDGQPGVGMQIRKNHTLESQGTTYTFTLSNIMVKAGQEEHDYEPYTGGKPSPSIDYPQYVVGAGQRLLEGDQLVPYPFDDTTCTKAGITCTDLGDGSVHVKGTSTDVIYFNIHLYTPILLKAGKYSFVAEGHEPGLVNVLCYCSELDAFFSSGSTFVLDTDREIKIYMEIPNGVTVDKVVRIMLNEGAPKPYEPYTGGVPKVVSVGSIGGKLIGENLIDVAGIYVTLWGVYQENGTRITVDGDKVTIEVLKQSNDILIPLLKPTHSFHCSLTYTFSDDVEANARPFSFRTNDNHVYGDAQIPGTVIQFGSTEDNTIYRIGIGVGSSGGYFKVGTTITLTRSYVNETGNGFTPYTVQPFTVLTPNGLLGIPVSSGGNYTDSNGQQWVADYVDLARGKYVKKVMCSSLKEAVWNDGWNEYFHIDGTFLVYTEYFNNDAIKGDCEIICSHFVRLSESILTSEKTQCQNGQGAAFNIAFRVPTTLANSIAEWEQWVSDNNMQLLFPLKTPIETDLTEEDIAQYKSLCMNYPNTTIINDENAYMEVEYVEDTKIYVDNLEKKHNEDIQALKTAIIALGGTI